MFDLIEGCDWPWAQMRQQGAVGILGHRNSRILTQDMHMIIMSLFSSAGGMKYVVIGSFNETISLQFCHWSCVLMQKGSTTQTTQMKQYNFCHVHRHIILYA